MFFFSGGYGILGALGTIIQCSMLILKLLVVHKGSLHYCTVQYVYNGGTEVYRYNQIHYIAEQHVYYQGLGVYRDTHSHYTVQHGH